MVNRPWQVPWPSSVIVNDAIARAWASSAARRLASSASAAIGSMTSSSRRPRIRRAFASCCRALSSMNSVAAPGHPVRDVVGECVDGGDDHACLVGPHLTGRQRRPDRAVVLQRCREAVGAVGLGAGRTGGVGPPVRRGGGAGVEAGLDGAGVAQDPHEELVELRAGLGEQDQGVARVSGGHRPQGRVGERVQVLATPAGEGSDLVCVGVWMCRHGATLPETTDTRSQAREPLWRKGSRAWLWMVSGQDDSFSRPLKPSWGTCRSRAETLHEHAVAQAAIADRERVRCRACRAPCERCRHPRG